MSKCHWEACEQPSLLGRFSIMDKTGVRRDFCGATHQQLFLWLDMPPPERQKPFPDRPSVVQQLISALKPAE